MSVARVASQNGKAAIKKRVMNPAYQGLLLGYEKWLKVSGYHSTTCTTNCQMIRTFLAYQEHQRARLADWESLDFKRYMDYSKTRENKMHGGGLSSTTLNHIAYALELFQKYLRTSGQAGFYIKLERWPHHYKPIEILTPEQIEGLYESCDGSGVGLRQKAVLGLCYGCGLRSSEACNLELGDLWWSKGVLQVRKSKTKRSRLVPMTKRVMDDLSEYIEVGRPLLLKEKVQPYVLVSAQGNPARHRVLYKQFQQLLQARDLPQCGLHVLRHSIASHLTASGMPSPQVAELLGHKTLNSTQIYTHLNEKR